MSFLYLGEDIMIHTHMDPAHVGHCKDGICDDGHLMITEQPDPELHDSALAFGHEFIDGSGMDKSVWTLLFFVG